MYSAWKNRAIEIEILLKIIFIYLKKKKKFSELNLSAFRPPPILKKKQKLRDQQRFLHFLRVILFKLSACNFMYRV